LCNPPVGIQEIIVSLSRRDLSLLLPALAASNAAAAPANLPSQVFKFEDLKVKGTGPNYSRDVLAGATHSGSLIDMHITDLGPGKMPHAAHHHEHEEMIMVQEGTLEVTISGKAAIIGPGSAAYVASNEEHGWKNVGDGRARYFVMAFNHPVAPARPK
jgi:mannose-6-phosphate isomerase-like protein (cupin superfamily)